jgi:hypothetical protein
MKKLFIYFFVLTLALPQTSFAQEKTSAKDALKTISFDRGFLGGVNKEVTVLVEKIEVFRKAQKENFQKSLNKVDTRRREEKDAKPAIKAITFMHILILATVLFIFSLQFVFYIVCALVAFWILRKIFIFIIRIFRKRD